MRNRLVTAGIAAPVTLALAVTLSACASSGSTINGQGGNGAGGSTASTGSQGGSGTSSSAPSSSTSSSSNPSLSLAARLGQGITAVTSAHLALNINAAGHSITGSGDEKLSGGKLTALDLNETVTSAVSLRLIIVNGKTYVRLPSTLSHSSKPWALVTSHSSNPSVRAFASTLASAQSSASLSSITTLVSAARTVKQTGSNTYYIDVNPAKLPGNYQGKQALEASGLTSIPINITLDSAGRPVLVTENLSVSGQKVSTKITVGSYNQPVHIAAPPASQVSTS